jgi:GxxExxY protein
MNANEHESRTPLDGIIEGVIGAAYEVSNVLGSGFLEKVYERALISELRLRGLKAKAQVLIPVSYKGVRVGEYQPDLLVEGQLIVELKCVECFANDHIAQCLNYLKASGLKLALLINFQHPKVEWKRIILSCFAFIRVHSWPNRFSLLSCLPDAY